MAHDIFESRFVSTRTDAWHGILKHQLTGQENAVEAYAIVGGDLKQFSAPLQIQGRHEVYTLKDSKALMGYMAGEHDGGYPMNGGTAFEYGVVSMDYEQIFHAQFAEIWHKITGASIETMGLLGNGATLFLTSKMPSIDIAGDEVTPYLVGKNPLDGVSAIRCYDAITRVVCANTLAMSASETHSFDFRGIHHKGVTDKLEAWLREVWASQQEKIAAIKEACEVLAKTPCAETDLTDQVNIFQFARAIYPIDPLPEKAELRQRWEIDSLKQATHINLVRDLFVGKSPTITTATQGTLWGAVQAVAEYEDHYRKRRQARSIAFGDGAIRKERALNFALSLVS